jgi:hypothetical protein
MKPDYARKLVEQALVELANARRHLNYSFQQVAGLPATDVCNIIAHDYAGAKAAEIFSYCREQKPVFDAICDAVTAYVGKALKALKYDKIMPKFVKRSVNECQNPRTDFHASLIQQLGFGVGHHQRSLCWKRFGSHKHTKCSKYRIKSNLNPSMPGLQYAAFSLPNNC